MHRSLRTAWEAVILGALSAGCLPHDHADSQGGSRPIEMVVANDAETLDPRYATDAVGLRATRLVHAGLVRLDPDTLAPLPYLAKGWRWVDPLTLQIDLRDDVRFHSGAPFDSRDVVETLRAMASPKVASRLSRVVDAIASAEAPAPHTVIVHLGRPHATLLTDLEIPILRAAQAASPPAPAGTLDGLGPYRVAGVSQGEVRLVPADGGALARPARAVTLRTVHDENARALRLIAGRADVALNLMSPTLLPALAAQPGLAVSSRAGANLTYGVMNESQPWLGDVRVRRALSTAIDRATLCQALFDGRAHPAGGLISPAHWAHANLPALPFDPDASRLLLREAGALHAHLTILTSTERLRGDVARVIAQELGDVGLDVTVIPLELGTMLARLNAGEFDIAILQLPEMTEPNVLRHFLHSALAPPAGANRGRVADSVLDSELDAADREGDPAARRAIYARVEARQIDRVHVLPLWYEDQVAVTSARARTFSPSAEGRWLGLARLP